MKVVKGAGLGECGVKARKLELTPKTHWHRDVELRPDESRRGQRLDVCHHESPQRKMRNCWLLDDFKWNPVQRWKMPHRNWTSCPVLVLPSWDWLSKLNLPASSDLFRTYRTTLLQLERQVCILQWQEEQKTNARLFSKWSWRSRRKQRGGNQRFGAAFWFTPQHCVAELSEFDKWGSYLFRYVLLLKTQADRKKTSPQLFHLANARQQKKIDCAVSAKTATFFIFVWEAQLILGLLRRSTVSGYLQNILFCFNHIVTVFNASNLKILQNLIASLPKSFFGQIVMFSLRSLRLICLFVLLSHFKFAFFNFTNVI